MCTMQQLLSDFFPTDNRDALFSDQPQSIDVYAFFFIIFRCFDIAWFHLQMLLLLATLVDILDCTATSWTNFRLPLRDQRNYCCRASSDLFHQQPCDIKEAFLIMKEIRKSSFAILHNYVILILTIDIGIALSIL